MTLAVMGKGGSCGQGGCDNSGSCCELGASRSVAMPAVKATQGLAGGSY